MINHGGRGIFSFKSGGSATILANFALTMLKAMLVMAFLGLMLINEDGQHKYDTDGVKPPIFAMVVLTWSNDRMIDLDLHALCPTGEHVAFNNREACFANLERDARGGLSDWTIVNGQQVVSVDNREVITFRAPVQGEWILNAHWFFSQESPPIVAHVEIISFEPTIHVVFQRDITFESSDEEVHVVRFKMHDNKILDGFDYNNPRMIIKNSINGGGSRGR